MKGDADLRGADFVLRFTVRVISVSERAVCRCMPGLSGQFLSSIPPQSLRDPSRPHAEPVQGAHRPGRDGKKQKIQLLPSGQVRIRYHPAHRAAAAANHLPVKGVLARHLFHGDVKQVIQPLIQAEALRLLFILREILLRPAAGRNPRFSRYPQTPAKTRCGSSFWCCSPSGSRRDRAVRAGCARPSASVRSCRSR